MMNKRAIFILNKKSIRTRMPTRQVQRKHRFESRQSILPYPSAQSIHHNSSGHNSTFGIGTI